MVEVYLGFGFALLVGKARISPSEYPKGQVSPRGTFADEELSI